MSSALEKDNSLKAEDRVIEICSKLHATEYINPSGGIALYEKKNFKQAGIDLYFLKPGKIEYKQFDNTFVPSLSIIDVLMFNDIDSVNNILKSCTLI
jgi:hypothetical protein